MKEEKQKQQEPTIKELLEITRIVADLAISILNENRQLWSFVSNKPKTTEERLLRTMESELTLIETTEYCIEAQKAFIKYKDLLNLDIEKPDTAEEAEPNTGEPENGTTNTKHEHSTSNTKPEPNNDSKHSDTSTK